MQYLFVGVAGAFIVQVPQNPWTHGPPPWRGAHGPPPWAPLDPTLGGVQGGPRRGFMGSLDKFSATSLATHLGGRVGKEEDSEAIQSERESELYCSILHYNLREFVLVTLPSSFPCPRAE